MKFVEFCENRFQELKMKSDSRIDQDIFDAKGDSEIKAVHGLLSQYRKILTYLFYPKCLLDYCLVELGKQKAPEPVLVNKFKKQKEEEELKKNGVKEGVVAPIHKVPMSEKKDA